MRSAGFTQYKPMLSKKERSSSFELGSSLMSAMAAGCVLAVSWRDWKKSPSVGKGVGSGSTLEVSLAISEADSSSATTFSTADGEVEEDTLSSKFSSSQQQAPTLPDSLSSLDGDCGLAGKP